MFSAASFSGVVEIKPSFSPRPQISHVVFDFDGTLSWLRHGWPEIMYELFKEYLPAPAGEAGRGIHEFLIEEILALNGKPSIHQMIRGVELVRERGGQLPDPEELLREYQRRLDLVIQERTEAILSGKARREDFVVYGARSFLERLRERDLTLIILSGTVEHRVKEEAGLLDLAGYFGEHIYGGTADLAQSSKRAVIERLLGEERTPRLFDALCGPEPQGKGGPLTPALPASEGDRGNRRQISGEPRVLGKIKGEHLLAFGDGPVEIQVAKKVGGLAVAVASDEADNGSGKMHPQKHKQLAAAGADVLIPDYRDAAALLECILSR